MRFAKAVFWIAGVYGVLVIAPLFFLLGATNRMAPPPVTHAEFYYGFATVTLMWQVAFFLIAGDPARYRPLMIPPALAKIGYAIIIVTMHLQGRVRGEQIPFAIIDFGLAILFFAAFASVGAYGKTHH